MDIEIFVVALADYLLLLVPLGSSYHRTSDCPL